MHARTPDKGPPGTRPHASGVWKQQQQWKGARSHLPLPQSSHWLTKAKTCFIYRLCPKRACLSSDSVPVLCAFCKPRDCGVGLRSLSPHPRPCPMHSSSQNSSSSNTGRPGTWAASARFSSTHVETGLRRVWPPPHLRGKTSAPPALCRHGLRCLSHRCGHPFQDTPELMVPACLREGQERCADTGACARRPGGQGSAAEMRRGP